MRSLFSSIIPAARSVAFRSSSGHVALTGGSPEQVVSDAAHVARRRSAAVASGPASGHTTTSSAVSSSSAVVALAAVAFSARPAHGTSHARSTSSEHAMHISQQSGGSSAGGAGSPGAGAPGAAGGAWTTHLTDDPSR